MPHLRKRHLLSQVKLFLSHSPIVALFGHRQVGKTTLSTLISDTYFTLDNKTTRSLIEADPMAFLMDNARKKTLVIDECQLAPSLFPAMKEYIRKNPRPGSLLITGSVRFTSRQAIRESLTGRFISSQLLPFDYQEIEKGPLSRSLEKLMHKLDREFPSVKSVTENELVHFSNRGTLPGCFAIRNQLILSQKLEDQIETLLERDLRLLNQTTLSYKTLRNVLSSLVPLQGRNWSWADLSRDTGVSVPSLQKLLRNFESMFLIRSLPVMNSSKKYVFYFEDQGEANSLLESSNFSNLITFEKFLYQHIRTQWIYGTKDALRCSQYATRGGALIPFVIQDSKGSLALLPSLEENPSHKSLKSASSFLKNHPNAFVLHVHPGSRDFMISKNQRSIPARALLS